MNTLHGKKITLFLPNGTADSLVTAELSNWNGMAIKIPRVEVKSCDNKDLTGVGVYFLFFKEEDDTDSVYIGEAENVKKRLIDHLSDEKGQKEWITSVAFIGRDLNKASIRYLENRLVEETKRNNRYKVVTKNTFQDTVLKESDKAEMEEFMDNIKILLNILGFKPLEPILNTVKSSGSPLLTLIRAGREAKGYETSEGFVLLKGSRIKYTTQPSTPPYVIKLREQYKADGKLDEDGKVLEDLLFSSSTAAASFVTSWGTGGPKNWLDENGRTLREIHEENQNDKTN